MLNQFELLAPLNLNEALTKYAELGNKCKILAGGTDVLVEMHGGRIYDCLMDIKNLDELKGVEYSPESGLVIGALTTHRYLERMPLIKELYPALYDGVSQVGAVQTRYRGTIGGNICNAAPSGDSLGPLLALDARFVVQSMQGIREISFEDFFTGAKKTALNPGELLVKILLPPPPAKSGSAYTKFTRRNAMDLALLGVAVNLTSEDGKMCKNVRISLSTSAPTVIRAKNAEQFLTGKELTEDVLKEAGVIASKDASPRSSWRSSEEYRRELLKSIVPRTIKKAQERIKE
ncbi:MAG TPA: FAD binding domain-containing protein [Anaerovoracaceae bacterium]|nr:FAD binding domain-containing protein [Anaerovoracaceae bacterium]